MLKEVTQPQREWLTISEAAERTQYNRQHIQLIARTGKVKAVRTKNGYLIFQPSLDVYVSTMRRRGHGPGVGGKQK